MYLNYSYFWLNYLVINKKEICLLKIIYNVVYLIYRINSTRI